MKVSRLNANESEYMSLSPVSDSDWRTLNSFNKGHSLADQWKPIEMERDRFGSARVLPASDFPALAPNVPVFSQRAVEALYECLTRNGELLPLSFPGGQYYAFICLNTVDCLDYERSSITRLPSGGIGRIHRYFFLADRLAEAEIFRLPHYSSLVFVTDSFVQRVLQHGLTGFEFVVVWDSQLS